MIRRTVQGVSAVGLLCLVGCLHPVAENVDATVCDLAAIPRDLQPLEHADLSPPPRPEEKKPEAPAVKGKDKGKPPPLTVPDDLLPGGKVAGIFPDPPVPPDRADPDYDRKRKEYEARRKEWETKFRKALPSFFPPLPPVGDDPPDPPGPEGRPYTLADLQKLAMANSPLIRQAAARIKEAQGNAIQVGLPPNPNMGYEGDTIGTSGGPGYQGGFVEQKVIVSNKLQLARAAATMDVRNAELALFRAQTDLMTRVRGGYFALLVAHESVRINRALVKFTDEVYQYQVKQVLRGGLAAPYEPMYLRALAVQARTNLVQARNRRTAAWKQLASSLGLPGMPPVRVAGRIDIPIPVFHYKTVLAKMLANHSDIRTAENALQQAHFNLQLAKVTPIPDPNLRLLIQKDRTGPPYEVAPSFVVTIPVPVWDRNQGGIMQAQGVVVRQSEEAHRVRTELTRTLADAFERYENNRVLLGYYRDRILPDLVRAYRGILVRYQRELPGAGIGTPPPGFNDLVVAQQNLAGSIASYVTTLGALWQAVVDVADLVQTKDLFGLGESTQPVPEIPDLEALPSLPCCHPCSPLPGAHHKVADGEWPSAESGAPRAAPPEKLPTLPAPKPLPEKRKEEATALPAGVDPRLLAPPPPMPGGR
jgi:cobalt-zinc-cadmium efflux system outer membrane protein